MQKLEVKASKKGVIAEVIESLPETILMMAIIMGEFIFVSYLKTKYNQSIFDLLNYLKLSSFEFATLGALTIINMVLFGYLITQKFRYYIYGWKLELKEYNTIMDDKITEVWYTYPYNKYVSTTVCHQIISVQIKQTWASLLFNTGDIIIHGITKTNANSENFAIKMTRIYDPEKVKNEIEAMFPNYTTLEVNLTKSN